MINTEVELPKVAATPAEFVGWLDTFASADALAEWLSRHGVTGHRRTSSHCPLAKLAQHCLDTDAEVGCIGLSVRGFAPFPLPLPAVEFVVRFDNGRYPELVVDRRMHVCTPECSPWAYSFETPTYNTSEATA